MIAPIPFPAAISGTERVKANAPNTPSIEKVTSMISVPDAVRGRVMGIYMLAFLGITPVGALLSAPSFTFALQTPPRVRVETCPSGFWLGLTQGGPKKR
jgi:hypothetical protein